MADDNTNYRLLSDEPAYEFKRKDELRFGPIAEVLAGAALQAESPITIGVFGNWGTGKTSLMRLMMKMVAEKGKIVDVPGEKERDKKVALIQKQVQRAAVPVWFNAWQYEREEHLIVPLIATIAREVERKREEWGKIELKDDVSDAARKALNKMTEGSKDVCSRLRAALYGISVTGKLPVPLPGGIEIGASVKDMVDRYEAITQDTLMARSLYFDAFDKLHDLSRDAGVKKPQIVVFIDDLDRCFPEQAVHLLESIKLVLHLPGFAFVLGIYDKIINEFIRNKYLSKYPLEAIKATSGEEEGADGDLRHRMNEYLKYFDKYLEKIVQVRHYVPEREAKDMHGYVEALLDEAHVKSEFIPDVTIPSDRRNLLELIAEVGECNPRDIVRKVNGLIVKWRIANDETGQENEDFNLLSGLINEAYLDRVARNESRYRGFVILLDREFGQETYGRALAADFALDDNKEMEHESLIETLKKKYPADKEGMGTMNSLIDTLQNDRFWCSVLRTEPGGEWLADRSFREGASERYGGEEARGEAPESADREKEGLRGKFEAKGFRESGPLLAELRLKEIQGSSFTMGSPESEKGRFEDETQHVVQLDNFQISAIPVTQALYESVMGANPSHSKGADLPVESVSWTEARAFCEQLTKMLESSGLAFTLPTEAQWEYACRAGSEEAFCFGDDEEQLDEYAWYANNSDGRTHPVGQKKPNSFGLYDMHGNVWEWCHDWYDAEYYTKEEAGVNPTGPGEGSGRVIAAAVGATFRSSAGRRFATATRPAPGASTWVSGSSQFRRRASERRPERRQAVPTGGRSSGARGRLCSVP